MINATVLLGNAFSRLATQNIELIKKMISGSRLAVGSGGVVSVTVVTL
jgi:hypothetical protein